MRFGRLLIASLLWASGGSAALADPPGLLGVIVPGTTLPEKTLPGSIVPSEPSQALALPNVAPARSTTMRRGSRQPPGGPTCRCKAAIIPATVG